MRRLFYVTPPEGAPDRPLSDGGLARLSVFAQACPPVASVFSSFERGVMDTADRLAGTQGLQAKRVLSLQDVDRTATGQLPAAEVAAAMQSFLARPRQRVNGWERAVDAQMRVVMTLKRVLAEAPEGDLAVVAHGAIGALFRAYLLGAPIDPAQAPPAGADHVMVVAVPQWQVLRDWTPLDEYAEAAA